LSGPLCWLLSTWLRLQAVLLWADTWTARRTHGCQLLYGGCAVIAIGGSLGRSKLALADDVLWLRRAVAVASTVQWKMMLVWCVAFLICIAISQTAL
jgi:hypothetical protein